jgi:hypothetical protein
LCNFIERGLSPEKANDAMLKAAEHKANYHWLTPPPCLGPISVADVDAATSVAAHVDMVKRWAAQMWLVWSPHHATVRAWADAAHR